MKDYSSDSLLININESFLNHNTKINYSWEATLKLMEAKNQVFAESISFFLTIWFNKSWIWFLNKISIDSNNFSLFIKIMKSWLNHYNFEYIQGDLLLNYCSSHKNSLTLNLLKNLHIKNNTFLLIVLNLHRLIYVFANLKEI